MRPRVPATVMALLLLAGCGADTARGEVTAAAAAFAGGEPAAACGMLAPETLSALEERAGGMPCAQALAELGLSRDTSVQGVEVAGESGQVRLAGQVVFLARFPDGWRVTAAGCERTDPDPAIPYDCEVEP